MNMINIEAMLQNPDLKNIAQNADQLIEII